MRRLLGGGLSLFIIQAAGLTLGLLAIHSIASGAEPQPTTPKDEIHQKAGKHKKAVITPEAISTPVDFARDIFPIFQERCFTCHGPQKQKNNLRLDAANIVMAGGASGPAVIAGKADQSLLLQRILGQGSEQQMPAEGKPLTGRQAGLIKAWIDQGAKWPAGVGVADAKVNVHWAFERPGRPRVPDVADGEWARTPIDRFILAALEARKLAPRKDAHRSTLIRRAQMDMVGLPPTPDDIDAFSSDESPDAYERLVDRLLGSPAFGERWGRHWLDIARFGESAAYEYDNDRPNAWPYRDFVIRAINQDLSYRTFIQWQLAGDEIEPSNPMALAATGFLTAGPAQDNKPTPLENFDSLDDTLSTAFGATLGMTIGCARCHNHKYDPIPQRDYYQLLAAFTGSKRIDFELKGFSGDGMSVKSLGMTDRGPKPPKTVILNRGNPEMPGDPVAPGFISALTDSAVDGGRWKAASAQPEKTTGLRRTVAQWMADPKHGGGFLMARVIVNRLWQHHFGQGIVRSSGNFGLTGDPPSHPELLDWMAWKLIDDDWNLKPLHRMMLTSRVYQQGTDFDAKASAADFDNRLLWRRAPQRLEAEVIRDSIMAVSGTLNQKMGGPSIRPWIHTDAIATGNSKKWPDNIKDGPATWRRSIYIFTRRSILMPMIESFDGPNAMTPLTKRMTTTTAPQALFFLNNEFIHEQATHMAKELIRTTGGSRDKMVMELYRTALGRMPEAAEFDPAGSFLSSQMAEYAAGLPESERSRAKLMALRDLCKVVLSLEEFIYID